LTTAIATPGIFCRAISARTNSSILEIVDGCAPATPAVASSRSSAPRTANVSILTLPHIQGGDAVYSPVIHCENTVIVAGNGAAGAA
jgi:hypothetical protein